MEITRRFGTVILAAMLFAGLSLSGQNRDKLSESEHRAGPHGLEGWTLDSSVPPGTNHGAEQFAFTLVIARDGREQRRIKGEPIIWNWMFWADGRQIALETGPLHFSMDCVLLDLATGRRIEDYDCYHMPGNEPDWVIALENTR